MKVVMLIFAILLAFGFVCKKTLDHRCQIAVRQQLLATATTPSIAIHPQPIDIYIG